MHTTNHHVGLGLVYHPKMLKFLCFLQKVWIKLFLQDKNFFIRILTLSIRDFSTENGVFMHCRPLPRVNIPVFFGFRYYFIDRFNELSLLNLTKLL